ncbi:pyrophosphatase [Nitrospira sp. Ecomares 2.1]
MSTDGSWWLMDFAEAAKRSDRFVDREDHALLLATGLMGEAGSVLTELKKENRERNAYPVYRHRMHEEVGDFLWYFVRLCHVVAPGVLPSLPRQGKVSNATGATSLNLFLQFGASVGDVLRALSEGQMSDVPLSSQLLQRVWSLLQCVAVEASVDLCKAAQNNGRKTSSRWPTEKRYVQLFDEKFPEEEQLPRRLEIEFRERERNTQKVLMLRCNGINLGDRLTDNIEDPDGYRYHDIFHFSHVAYLGWSPVIRALLKCKRKSSSKKDEGQDGARAVILEEAVAAIIFSRAKQLSFFDGIDHVDYDLLKTVKEFITGFEVDTVPLWQWEKAILEGYRVFRLLRENAGGHVKLDLTSRSLSYLSPQQEAGV